MIGQEVSNPTNRETLAQGLATTYNNGRYTAAWRRVNEYREFREYVSSHPAATPYTVANSLDIPRGRVRGWMQDNTTPDPIRALQTAQRNNWLDLTWSDAPFTAFNVLVGWIFASGSITSQTMVPHLTVDTTTQPYVTKALERAEITEYRTVRSEAAKRATEVIPEQSASVLGRLLYSLGAPIGPKSSETSLTLPDYLTGAPEHIRLNFARTYVWLRGTKRSDRPETPIQIREERSVDYRRELKQFFNSCVPNATCGKSDTFRLTAEAATILHQPPQFSKQAVAPTKPSAQSFD